MTASCTELVLVRHGETDWNVEHRLQGQCAADPPLNSVGWSQAAALAKKLQDAAKPFDALVSSDLRRTSQTASVVSEALQLPVQHSAALRERHVGVLQGLLPAEAAELHPEALRCLRGGPETASIPGGGESLAELQARVAAGLEAVAAAHAGQRVLVITHGGVLQAAHRHVTGRSYDRRMLNGGLSTLRLEGRRWAVMAWNDVAHLAGAEEGAGGGDVHEV